MRTPFGKIIRLLSGSKKSDFVVELDKDGPGEENVATARDLREMLSRCPQDAKVAFGVNEGGNMRILLDTFLHYNKTLNEIVLYPFNRPTADEVNPPDESTEPI